MTKLGHFFIWILLSSSIVFLFPKHKQFCIKPLPSTAIVSQKTMEVESDFPLHTSQNQVSNFSNDELIPNKDLTKSDLNKILHSFFKTQNTQTIDINKEKRKMLLSLYEVQFQPFYKQSNFGCEIKQYIETGRTKGLDIVKTALKSQKQYENQITKNALQESTVIVQQQADNQISEIEPNVAIASTSTIIPDNPSSITKEEKSVASLSTITDQNRKTFCRERIITENLQNIYENATSARFRLYNEILNSKEYEFDIKNIKKRLIVLEVLKNEILLKLKPPIEEQQNEVLPSKNSIKSKIQQLLESPGVEANDASAP